MTSRELELEIVLNYLDDVGLARACQVNTRFYYRICNSIWLNLTMKNFGLGSDLINKYLGNMNYREYYLDINYRLEKATNFEDLLDISIQWDRLDIARTAINLGADIHYQHDKPLALASLRGHDNMVILLLSKKANPNSRDGRALFLASINNHPSVVKILLENGASVGIKEAQIAAKEYQEIVDILGEHLE